MTRSLEPGSRRLTLRLDARRERSAVTACSALGPGRRVRPGMHPTHWAVYVQPLGERGVLRLVNGETELSETLVCRPTLGRTIGHRAVQLLSGEKRPVHLGDLRLPAEP